MRKAGTFIHDRAGEAPRPTSKAPPPAAPESTGLRPPTVYAPVEASADDAPADTGAGTGRRGGAKKKES
ncbi:hypothetical protein [uncultured Rhodospira sp.]|uniref:hypothetical protein n=1 Tax=uncultured Rhodospira sp. TaxID=1936189 RepID=UPI0026283AC9|nr:hypothetical protein [uncultured Rhodospira sp.]